jgi:hypothetical protein
VCSWKRSRNFLKLCSESGPLQVPHSAGSFIIWTPSCITALNTDCGNEDRVSRLELEDPCRTSFVSANR